MAVTAFARAAQVALEQTKKAANEAIEAVKAAKQDATVALEQTKKAEARLADVIDYADRSTWTVAPGPWHQPCPDSAPLDRGISLVSRERGICLLTLSNDVWLVLHAATTADKHDAVAIGATNPADKHDAVAMGATGGAAAADGPGRHRCHATLVTSSNRAIDHPLRLA